MSTNDRYLTNSQLTWHGAINLATDHVTQGVPPQPQGQTPGDLHNNYLNTYNQNKQGSY